MSQFRAIQTPSQQRDAVAAMMAFAWGAHLWTADDTQQSIPAQNADIADSRVEGAVTIRTTDLFAEPVAFLPPLLHDWVEFQEYLQAGRLIANLRRRLPRTLLRTSIIWTLSGWAIEPFLAFCDSFKSN